MTGLALVALLQSGPIVPPPPPPPQPKMGFYFFEPCRWIDTRIPGPVPGSCPDAPWYCAEGPLEHNETRRYLVQASGVCIDSLERPVPLGADTVIMRVTLTGATAKGWIIPFDATSWRRPHSPILRFEAGETIGQNLMIHLGQEQGQMPGEAIKPDLAVFAWMYGRSGHVHMIVDLIGYVAPYCEPGYHLAPSGCLKDW